jgi:drug/metabolite transporter (DMT)-like permease
MPPVTFLLAVTHHASVRIAEVAFVLLLFAGVWLAAADRLGQRRIRSTVAGVAIALSGLLLIVASHFGTFG